MTALDDPKVPQAGRRGPYSKGLARRQEILDKTMQALINGQIEAPTLRSLADAIGESHRTVQHYFPTREVLLLEVIRVYEAEIDGLTGTLMDTLQTAARRNTQTPGMIAVFTEMLALSVEPGNVHARRFFSERFRKGRGELAVRLAAEHEALASLPETEIEGVAALLLAASDGLQIQWLLDPGLDLSSLLRKLLVAAPDLAVSRPDQISSA